MYWIANPCPAPFYADKAEKLMNEFKEELLNAGLTPLNEMNQHAESLLMAIFGNSPFLGKCIMRDVSFTHQLLIHGPDVLASRVFEDLSENVPLLKAKEQVMSHLRRAKAKIALLTAAADITHYWPLAKITNTLSMFACSALDLAVAHLVRERMVAGDIEPPAGFDALMPSPATPDINKGSGFIILGMGKLGASELNYSSDIDLIVLYDADIVRYRGKKHIQDCFIKITQNLVRMMQDRTEDGYVFRTDLRLRPDPGATAIALSAEAAEIYYQSVGLNWERSAMIKARPVAGDILAGYDFLERLRGFVWRTSLDYAALEDIHAIKNQIHRHHRHGDICILGQDVKLGRGGIREIEFFAQINQLIAGGRERDLRVRETVKALTILEKMERIDHDTSHTLIEAYQFLRSLEHRLQMVGDEQTHSMPDTREGLEHISCFMGYDDVTTFEKHLLHHLTHVKQCYDELLSEATGGDQEQAMPVLNFAPDTDTAEVRAELAQMGFAAPEKVIAIISGWSLGRYRSCRTTRARQILKSITPKLLSYLGQTADPDGALLKFDDFLKQLPAGVQLFSLLQAHPWLLELLSEIMGIAPALAELLARQTYLLDAVLSVDFFDPLPPTPVLKEMLLDELEIARDFQDVMDISRRWVNEQKFRLGVQLLRRAVNTSTYSEANTNLADAVLQVLFEEVMRDFEIRHGKISGGAMVVVGMGKLGGRELTFTSDLDLVFIYRNPEDIKESSGPKQLAASHYYARLSQSFITAITAMTGEGRLYEVDMRLRPSGNAGPIAVSFEAFCQYQENEAWTWEHLALTRARICAGDKKLAHIVETEIQKILTTRHEPQKLLVDAAEMRQRLRNEFGTQDQWEVKHSQGGLIDIEFICQYLQLRHGADMPDILATNTAACLQHLIDRHLIDETDGQALQNALTFLNNIQAILRISVRSDFNPAQAPKGLQTAVAAITNTKDFEGARQGLGEANEIVIKLYRRIISDPAAKLKQGSNNA